MISVKHLDKILVLSVLGLGAHSSAAPIRFKLTSDGATKPSASVESKTEVETFVGKTSKVSGTLMFDPTAKSGGGTITVNVKDISTGIPLRDEHMNGAQWLDSAKFPTITFAAKEVKFVKGDQYQVKGNFTLHGVTKSITTMVTVKHVKESAATRKQGFKGDVLQVKTNFAVKLADYGVIIAGQAKGKVSETVNIAITAIGQSR